MFLSLSLYSSSNIVDDGLLRNRGLGQKQNCQQVVNATVAFLLSLTPRPSCYRWITRATKTVIRPSIKSLNLLYCNLGLPPIFNWVQINIQIDNYKWDPMSLQYQLGERESLCDIKVFRADYCNEGASSINCNVFKKPFAILCDHL